MSGYSAHQSILVFLAYGFIRLLPAFATGPRRLVTNPTLGRQVNVQIGRAQFRRVLDHVEYTTVLVKPGSVLASAPVQVRQVPEAGVFVFRFDIAFAARGQFPVGAHQLRALVYGSYVHLDGPVMLARRQPTVRLVDVHVQVTRLVVHAEHGAGVDDVDEFGVSSSYGVCGVDFEPEKFRVFKNRTGRVDGCENKKKIRCA